MLLSRDPRPVAYAMPLWRPLELTTCPSPQRHAKCINPSRPLMKWTRNNHATNGRCAPQMRGPTTSSAALADTNSASSEHTRCAYLRPEHHTQVQSAPRQLLTDPLCPAQRPNATSAQLLYRNISPLLHLGHNLGHNRARSPAPPQKPSGQPTHETRTSAQAHIACRTPTLARNNLVET